jgi:segregation and condensation protein B
MDYFGINAADDLPKIKEVLADQIVEPTIINHDEVETPVEETASSGSTPETELSVTETGELIINKNPDSENEG